MLAAVGFHRWKYLDAKLAFLRVYVRMWTIGILIGEVVFARWRWFCGTQYELDVVIFPEIHGEFPKYKYRLHLLNIMCCKYPNNVMSSELKASECLKIRGHLPDYSRTCHASRYDMT